MKSGERLALAIIVGLVLLLGSTTGVAAYAWHKAGNVRISIHESGPSGSDLSLTLPGMIVNTAIALCPVPTDAATNARWHEVAPALGAVASSLETLPDAVLVDVRNEDGMVRIEKSGAELLIRVVSRDELIDVAIPIETMRKLVHKLEASASREGALQGT